MTRFTILCTFCMLIELATASPLAARTPQPIGMAYAPDHWRQSLELYIPESGCGPFPLAIYIPGGGWLTGDSTQVVPYVDSLIERGFAVASVNHRWSQQAPFPAQIHDCKGALRFLRANADTFNLDQSRFVIFGVSSGSHLAALVATSSDVSAMEGSVGGNMEYSSSVQAVADVFGPTDLFAFAMFNTNASSLVTQLFNWPIQDIIDNMKNPKYADLVALVHSANPITHTTSNDPPVYLVHGDQDNVVPLSQSQIFYDALVSANVPATFTIVPGAEHDLPFSEFLVAFDFLASAVNATPPRLTDTNCDGVVDVIDMLAVINGWGDCPASCPADVNGDDVVNVDDLLAVINDWG